MRRLLPLFLSLTALVAAETVPTWTFDGQPGPDLSAVGNVRLKQPGPRRPDYPLFDTQNVAPTFDGQGARLVIKDPGADSVFDFKNGDPFTLEAWVRPDGLRKGENATIIGKGRTDPKAPNPSNQNWAVRLRVLYDTACLNFLFASPTEKGVKWHRWTTPTGFPNDGRWHHVAVRYEFGKPKSIRGKATAQPRAASAPHAAPSLRGVARRRPPAAPEETGKEGGRGGPTRRHPRRPAALAPRPCPCPSGPWACSWGPPCASRRPAWSLACLRTAASARRRAPPRP